MLDQIALEIVGVRARDRAAGEILFNPNHPAGRVVKAARRRGDMRAAGAQIFFIALLDHQPDHGSRTATAVGVDGGDQTSERVVAELGVGGGRIRRCPGCAGGFRRHVLGGDETACAVPAGARDYLAGGVGDASLELPAAAVPALADGDGRRRAALRTLTDRGGRRKLCEIVLVEPCREGRTVPRVHYGRQTSERIVGRTERAARSVEDLHHSVGAVVELGMDRISHGIHQRGGMAAAGVELERVDFCAGSDDLTDETIRALGADVLRLIDPPTILARTPVVAEGGEVGKRRRAVDLRRERICEHQR